MQINTNAIVSVTEANQNFSRVTRIAEKNGQAVIFKNNRPKYMVIDLENTPFLELTDDGAKAVDTLQRIQAEKSAAFFSGISPEDRESLIDAIHLVERVLKEKSGNTLPNISAENLSDLLIGNKLSKG